MAGQINDYRERASKQASEGQNLPLGGREKRERSERRGVPRRDSPAWTMSRVPTAKYSTPSSTKAARLSIPVALMLLMYAVARDSGVLVSRQERNRRDLLSTGRRMTSTCNTPIPLDALSDDAPE